MEVQKKKSAFLSSLCKYSIKEEELVANELVRAEIERAFAENRAFPIFPKKEIVEAIRANKSKSEIQEELFLFRNEVFQKACDNDSIVYERLLSDVRLCTRVVNAIYHLHRALAQEKDERLLTRRFVVLKEEFGKPTFYHISNDTTVISHVGQGPFWEEIPSIYLGLKLFDIIKNQNKKGGNDLFAAFQKVLQVEGRAIETGFSHTEVFTPEFSKAFIYLTEELINFVDWEKHVTEEEKDEEFSSYNIINKAEVGKILKGLDARLLYDELNFDTAECLKTVSKLEQYAKQAKDNSDRKSLEKLTSLLIIASGHDVHEIRNRANIALERIFAPKEYDAPLAVNFINTHVNEKDILTFSNLKQRTKYFVRVYDNKKSKNKYFANADLSFKDYPLVYQKETKQHQVELSFPEYGHYDYVILQKKKEELKWVEVLNNSGRFNVMPDLRGEFIMEIFADIHGHAKTFWHDESGHPGLVYNEAGEVIRLGNFSDLTVHLKYLKENYHITALYLLGAQKRGFHREDWAAGATSPSPFSPMSMTEIEEFLGGPKAFKELVKEAHSLDIKIILDIIPHLNRHSTELSDENVVMCYDGQGNLTPRASTDGRYGSWNDGKLLNYRRIEVWEWLISSVEKLIDKYDIDGIRFDSAHAVPVMMKKNNYPFVWGEKRDIREMVEGRIIVNDREDNHLVTTGYYDSACREQIAIPFHFYMMQRIEKKLQEKGKTYFVNLAECYWGHERFLSRSGIVPYNSSLFKICENILHGKSDVREIYHIYDSYFPTVLPKGTELLGILGNHDERRALNTFGDRGLRAAVFLTSFMSNIIMDYEGCAEGEGWKVFLDNIYVNWNEFEYAANRSVSSFYKDLYQFHTSNHGKGYLVWANNNMVASALKFVDNYAWLGVFNFSNENQTAAIQFDNPALPISDDSYWMVVDPVYSAITHHFNYYTGLELKTSKITTMVSFTERIKLLKLVKVDIKEKYTDFLYDSFSRLSTEADTDKFLNNFAFNEISKAFHHYDTALDLLQKTLIPLFKKEEEFSLELGLKRALYYMYHYHQERGENLLKIINKLSKEDDSQLSALGKALALDNKPGSLVFMSAEAEPFSKSGGLANVIYELPRELAKAGEEVYVITGFYHNGSEKDKTKMNEAVEKYNIKYTGINVHFKIMDWDYEVGVYSGMVEGVKYFLFDHYEFFDGLYWGVTSSEKLRRRLAFARASAELICTFGLKPHFTFTNDAYTGLFNGIVRSDYNYYSNPNFQRTTFLHIIHNGGWQYFDAYKRYENDFDLFRLFNLPDWQYTGFSDPRSFDSLNLMAAGIRFADRTITVSPSYAKQIEYACDGLEGILSNVIGISNSLGGDFKDRIITRFNSSNFVDHNFGTMCEKLKTNNEAYSKVQDLYPEILQGAKKVYSIKDVKRRNIAGRMFNKMLLQSERNLDVNPDILMFVMIHRITEQKGFQLLLESSAGIFQNLGYQAIIGGAISSGDKKGEEIAHGLYMLSQYYGNQASVSLSFQEVAIPLLAGDLFCMPSMSEPGGISQLEALACGLPVVARATGGLRDTVFPLQKDQSEIIGNGFLFSDYNSWAFYDAMERASKFLHSCSSDELYAVRKNAESSVYYWDKPARNYINEIYRIKEIIRIIDEKK